MNKLFLLEVEMELTEPKSMIQIGTFGTRANSPEEAIEKARDHLLRLRDSDVMSEVRLIFCREIAAIDPRGDFVEGLWGVKQGYSPAGRWEANSEPTGLDFWQPEECREFVRNLRKSEKVASIEDARAEAFLGPMTDPLVNYHRPLRLKVVSDSFPSFSERKRMYAKTDGAKQHFCENVEDYTVRPEMEMSWQVANCGKVGQGAALEITGTIRAVEGEQKRTVGELRSLKLPGLAPGSLLERAQDYSEEAAWLFSPFAEEKTYSFEFDATFESLFELNFSGEFLWLLDLSLEKNTPDQAAAYALSQLIYAFGDGSGALLAYAPENCPNGLVEDLKERGYWRWRKLMDHGTTDGRLIVPWPTGTLEI